VTVLPDPPDFVTPGQPVEAIWGNEVVAWVREAVAIVNTLMPIGCVIMYGGGSAPTNWLLCRGQAVSQTTYDKLFAVVGTNFNEGLSTPPAGTFRVPNMQARYPVGANAGSSIGLSGFWNGSGIGEVGGGYTAVMPNHNHTVPSHFHTLAGQTGPAANQHYHKGPGGVGNRRFLIDGHDENNEVPLHYLPVGVGTDIGGPRYVSFADMTAFEEQPHTHHQAGETGPPSRTLETNLVGGGNQIPPGIAFNFIIRAK
jgi:microcystin-dependent protein